MNPWALDSSMRLFQVRPEVSGPLEFLSFVAVAGLVVIDEMCHDVFIAATALESHATVTTARCVIGASDDGILWIRKSGTRPVVLTQVMDSLMHHDFECDRELFSAKTADVLRGLMNPGTN